MNFKLWVESIGLAFELAKQVADTLHCDQSGSCVAFAEYVTKKFIENGIKNFLIVEGWVKYKNEPTWHQHTWIEINGQKIDPTIIQFGEVNYINKIKRKYTPEEYLKLCDKYPDESEYIKRFKKNV